MLSFFVDGLLENTQLSKLLAVQSVPGSLSDGWHNATFFQEAEWIALYRRLKYLTRESLKPNYAFPCSLFPFLTSLSASNIVICYVSLVPFFTCTQQRQLFANLDSRSQKSPASLTALGQSESLMAPPLHPLANHGTWWNSSQALFQWLTGEQFHSKNIAVIQTMLFSRHSWNHRLYGWNPTRLLWPKID